MSYNQMGAIESDAGDYFGSQQSLLSSLKYLDPLASRNRSCLTSDYNELGISSSGLQNHNTAIGYYKNALQYADDSSLRAVIKNNLAYAYQQLHRYNEALLLYQSALHAVKDPNDKSRIITNIAYTKWLQNHAYPAIPILIRTLQGCEARGDLWGVNLNSDCLAEVYKPNNPDSAKYYSLKMYDVAKKLNSASDQLITLKRLIIIGKPANAKKYFYRYQALTDSIQLARNKSKNQFALIRYDAEKNKVDNLKLQRDNSDAKYQIVVEKLSIATLIMAIIISVIMGRFWYKNRKQEQQMLRFNAIQETKRKASKTVHDTLANDIYTLMKKVEHAASLDAEWLLDDIEDIYVRARDVSQELQTGPEEGFDQKINELLNLFRSELTSVSLAGNDAVLWKKVSTANKFELKYILQELMVNMQKHSHAKNVVVKFDIIDARLVITYADDGVGMPENILHRGGLENTGNRIKNMRGQITFGSNAGNGLQIQILLPLD